MTNSFQLRPYQQQALDAIVSGFQECRKQMAVLPTGSGKCWGAGTPILLASGAVKPVEQIQVGDVLIGPDGMPRTVTSTCSGTEMLYEVIPIKGMHYTINESHILSLKISGNDIAYCDGPHQPGSVANVPLVSYLKSTKSFRHVAKGWRSNVPAFYPETQPHPAIPAYMMGLWIGDGSCRTFSISKPDAEIGDAVTDYARSLGLVVRREASDGKCPNWHVTANHRCGRRGGANHALTALQELGLIQNKHIPKCYLTASEHNRRQLLAGLMDSDGHMNHGGFDFISKDRSIAEDVCFVARSIGLAAYMNPCVKGCQNGFVGTYYRVSISGDTHLIPTRIKRKQAQQRKCKKSPLITGITVAQIGVGTYYGFELSGPDRMFLLGDFTVAHNTILFSRLAQHYQPERTLILAHTNELIQQAWDKLYRSTGIVAGIEKAESSAAHSDAAVVSSIQSMSRRLDKYPADHFGLVVGDECHIAMGAQWQKTLNHFTGAKILGVTATGFRADKKALGEVFDRIAIEIKLRDLVLDGYLSKILVQTLPVNIDLSGVRQKSGDFDTDEVDQRLAPHLRAVAEGIKEHAAGRKTLVFVPLIRTSEVFVAICREVGLNAEHIDGKSDERAAILKRFSETDSMVLCNSSLLTTGYDEPSISCVVMLRPTRSRVLLMQMVGRGTRLHPGKENLLVLDPCFVSDRLDLASAATLTAPNDDIARAVARKARETNDACDLFDLESDVAKERELALKREMERNQRRQKSQFDPLSFATTVHDMSIVDYEPSGGWETAAPTPKQLALLSKWKFDVAQIKSKGHASKILDVCFNRLKSGLATPGQLFWIRKLGYPNPETATKESAAAYLDLKFKKNH